MEQRKAGDAARRGDDDNGQAVKLTVRFLQRERGCVLRTKPREPPQGKMQITHASGPTRHTRGERGTRGRSHAQARAVWGSPRRAYPLKPIRSRAGGSTDTRGGKTQLGSAERPRTHTHASTSAGRGSSASTCSL
jgi:hypothetical protein